MRSAIGRGTDATGVWSILKLAASDWLRHRSPRMGAALAYYSVFSLGPLLLVVGGGWMVSGYWREPALGGGHRRCRPTEGRA
jgi:hypothetical protein